MRWWPLLLMAYAQCKMQDPPPVTELWTDTFDRTGIGGNYYRTGSGYELSEGALSARQAHNHPLWLRKKLTRDVRIEFDCWSNDAGGDIKVELFGDGHSHDPDGGRYMATGYVLIFGGWSNSKSIIARMDEHGSDVVARALPKVESGKRYHWTIERRGRTVTWWVDPSDNLRVPFLTYDDPQPLEGKGHAYLGFNNWETDTWFDNLVVSPL